MPFRIRRIEHGAAFERELWETTQKEQNVELDPLEELSESWKTWSQGISSYVATKKKELSMKNYVSVEDVLLPGLGPGYVVQLTRAQVEKALEELNRPEELSVEPGDILEVIQRGNGLFGQRLVVMGGTASDLLTTHYSRSFLPSRYRIYDGHSTFSRDSFPVEQYCKVGKLGSQ